MEKKDLGLNPETLKTFLEIRKSIITESNSDIPSTEHRLEALGEYKGVEFINDSKATSVDLTWYSLERMNKSVIWIAGGIDTASDYENLKTMVAEKVKGIVCLTRNSKKLYNAFLDNVDIMVSVSTAEEAVRAGFAMAKKGDVVLLSPASGSFDLFESYQDRGNRFKKAVKNLMNNPTSDIELG
jgi:UDP-N-acetylmuramoylalanine--D-glutamate ligase